ncbi:MAG: heat-inducible transcriptional repressor HrcA [Nitrospiria bacterium]
MELDKRSKHVLKAVISSYIKTALPVGSMSLKERFDFGVGPATIRNIMADLEEGGFLTHPHTSAGRVPTEKGYRFYVDTLFEEDTFLSHQEQIRVEAEKLVKREDANALLQDTSKLLSDLTHYMSIVSAPKITSARIRHIEFIRLRANCVMAITVSEAGFVQNKFFDLAKDISQKSLNDISDYLNRFYQGMTLQGIREKLRVQTEKMESLYDHLETEAFELTGYAMGERHGKDAGELYTDGATHIFDLPDFSDVKIMKNLLEAVKEKQAVIQLLDKYIGSQGVQVFIGSENRFLGNHGFSLVVSQYKRGDRVLGALGVIGPTRMEYSRVIPLVDSAAKQVSRLLEDLS